MAYQRNLLEYLEATAARLPNKPSFCDESVSYTYEELLRGSRAIGTALARRMGGVNRPAVVLVDRTAVSVLGLLSVLQAGCYYVPVDRRSPPLRLAAILEQLSPTVLLCSRGDADLAASLDAPCLFLEDAAGEPPDDRLLAACRECVLDIDPAYMIFTSGSTGTPKGIPVSHRSVIDFTEWMAETCGITESDVLANQAPFYFDLSVKDLYQTLRQGTTTYILPKKCFLFPLLLVRFLQEKAVTALIWATSAFRLVASSGALEREIPHSVQKIILGGEALHASHLNQWRKALPRCRFINLYGPTEVTVDCTWFPIDREYADDEIIPIGKACRNMQVLLLDEDGKPAAEGEPGEICVRGIGLALGYYNDPEKTAAAFIQNPLNPHYPDRLYRTGDMGRLDPEGNLLFLARKDDQIKHMGYRIELGEVEAALDAVEGISSAVCFFDGRRDKIVCCYEGSLSEESLAKLLNDRLPRYMLPNIYRPYKRLPANPNGKVDRVRLRKEYEDG